MQAVVESPRSGIMRRAAPVMCGGALAAGAVLVAANDPAAQGSRFPGCIFHQATGLFFLKRQRDIPGRNIVGQHRKTDFGISATDNIKQRFIALLPNQEMKSPD